MLIYLRIQDLILIENLEISFQEGFHVLSGETGSGKSAIITALSLILGKRADTAVLRKGVSKGKVEGVFELSGPAASVLEKAGLSVDHEIIIRREILASGKSRAFLNDQPVSLSLLKEIGEHLVKFVGQHANQQLLCADTHRDLLDQYGECPVLPFSEAYQKYCDLEKQLKTLKKNETFKQQQIEKIKSEIEEIEAVSPKPNEDETLFSEYTLLTHAEDFQSKSYQLTEFLSGESSITEQLSAFKRTFEELLKIDASLKESYQNYHQCILELQEVSHILSRLQGSHEFSPERLTYVNDRMSELHKIKRKYGKTLEEVLQYAEAQKECLYQLENSDEQIDLLEQKILLKKKECDHLADELGKERRKAAEKLEKAILKHLQDLNMARAQFHVLITPQARTSCGDEKIEYFLSPNLGEKQVSVTECASGGELSRLMLAFQVLLAGKEKIPVIVFDEVDANIGGRTAVSVGAKLKEIGKEHQVLCITHFPQVALQADCHLQISKEEVDDRTLTLVQVLGDEDRERELGRMRGCVL